MLNMAQELVLDLRRLRWCFPKIDSFGVSKEAVTKLKEKEEKR